MRTNLYVSLVPFLLFSALGAPFQLPQSETVRAMVGDSLLALPPGQQAFVENGVTLIPVCPLLDPQAEQAVRAQLNQPAGPLSERDLSGITTLTLPAGLRSASALCRLSGLTDLTLEGAADYSLDFLLGVVGRLPDLKRLTLTGPADMETVPSAQTTDKMPLRLETAHAIFLGDTGMSMTQLLHYAAFLEQTAIAEVARDTGLRPQAVKPVLLLYGDEQYWNQLTGTSTFWGYYAAREQRIHMAHWKTPDAINSLLLVHELFHWLAWEEGKVDLPTWLNEGLAHNISYRVEQRVDGWLNPFVFREWVRMASSSEEPVPALATHREQDEFTITAVSHLLQTRGRDALVQFFALTRGGTAFEEAFAVAFGVTPDDFEAEYRAVVEKERAKR